MVIESKIKRDNSKVQLNKFIIPYLVDLQTKCASTVV